MPSYILLFLFPTDFIRVFWIVTPFDLVAALYIVSRIGSDGIYKEVLSSAFLLLLGFLIIVLLSGIQNSILANEHLILITGLLLSVMKGVAVVDAMLREDDYGVRYLLTGFLVLNAIQFILFVFGIGFSGAARFYGILNHSNGAAVFQTFACALALFSLQISRSILPLLVAISSIILIFLSGSRGGVVTIFALFLGYIAVALYRPTKRALCFLLVSVAFLLILYVWVDSIISILTASDLAGLSRVASFLESIAVGGKAGAADEFESARGYLNAAAFDYFLAEPSPLGLGYGGSVDALGFGYRPHNIFLSSLLELGFFGFLYIFILFVFVAYASFVVAVRRRGDSLFFLLYVAFFLAASKTPFYLLLGMPWVVMVGSIVLFRRGG